VDETTREGDRRLVLLVDHDVESRRQARHLLELHGLEVVQSSNGTTALELVQRLPGSFRLVLTDLDLPGMSGAVVAETLRVFRPELRVLCMAGRTAAGRAPDRRCLAKPLHGPDLVAALADAAEILGDSGSAPEEVIARARARFAVAGDLVEAALELARWSGWV